MTTATQTITSTGTFTAPATLINGSVRATAYGAPGGGGGAGAAVAGTIALAASGTLSCTIGATPTSTTGGTGYHTGGAGAAGGSGGGAGLGGGGSTAVVSAGSVLLLEAGGGGGQGGTGNFTTGGLGGSGGLTAGTGATGGQSGPNDAGHGGTGANNATVGTGGAYGIGLSTHGTAGSNGSGSTGGAGGAADTGSGVKCGGGGGGGAGHAGGGGGGGGSDTGAGGGGGGGSSFADSSVGSPTHTLGGSTLFGSVKVTYTVADPPYSPVLSSPANGSYAELATTPTFVFTYEPGTDSGALSTWAMRRKLSSGSTYNYWNASAGNWTSTTPVWNAGSYLTLVSGTPGIGACVYSYTFPSSSWTDGNTYNWSIATAEANYPSINQGTFASDFTAIASAMPTVVITNPAASEVLSLQAFVAAWTTTPGAGDSQTAYRLILYTAARAGGVDVRPRLRPVPLRQRRGVVGRFEPDHRRQRPDPELATGGTYWLYIQVTETGGQTSTWVGQEFSLFYDGPAQPIVSVNTTNDVDTDAPLNEVTVTAYLNAMAANDSSFESGTVGTFTVVSGPGAIATDTAWSADGTTSLQATSSGSGAIQVFTTLGTGGYPCTGVANLTVEAVLQSPAGLPRRPRSWWPSTTPAVG